MRKLILSLSALAVLAFAIPYAAPAKADPVVVVHHRGGWHPSYHHHHHGRTIVIHH
jgi:hypothetical protein